MFFAILNHFYISIANCEVRICWIFFPLSNPCHLAILGSVKTKNCSSVSSTFGFVKFGQFEIRNFRFDLSLDNQDDFFVPLFVKKTELFVKTFRHKKIHTASAKNDMTKKLLIRILLSFSIFVLCPASKNWVISLLKKEKNVLIKRGSFFY